MTADTAYDNAVQRYFVAWNATDPEAIAKGVAAAWTEDGSYTDPFSDVTGHEEIATVIATAHEMFPGCAFRLLGTVDGHHDVARFGWELVSRADGSAPLAGFDTIILADDGRIRDVSGFLDRMPGA